jgi:beta-lactam-binding protein with PASTA domain
VTSVVVRILVGVALSGAVACSAQEASAPAELVMPDVVGLYWTDAEPQLRAAGWTGFLVKASDVPVAAGDRNRIMVQTPTPGEHLETDATITLRFGR